jgi:shikimate 5-dehydrogenase
MAVNGLGMLVGQAAIAFERWTGIADADSMMRQAIGQLADSTAADSTAEDSTAQD